MLKANIQFPHVLVKTMHLPHCGAPLTFRCVAAMNKSRPNPGTSGSHNEDEIMLRNLTIAIVSVLMLGTASAAMAQSAQSSKDHGQQSYVCQTDEGYGRTLPCDMGGGN
jgi:hypothetical protein